MDAALGQWQNLLKHLRRLFPAQTPGSTNTSHTHDDVPVQQVLQALSACGLITVSNKAAHKRLVADMEAPRHLVAACCQLISTKQHPGLLRALIIHLAAVVSRSQNDAAGRFVRMSDFVRGKLYKQLERAGVFDLLPRLAMDAAACLTGGSTAVDRSWLWTQSTATNGEASSSSSSGGSDGGGGSKADLGGPGLQQQLQFVVALLLLCGYALEMNVNRLEQARQRNTAAGADPLVAAYAQLADATHRYISSCEQELVQQEQQQQQQEQQADISLPVGLQELAWAAFSSSSHIAYSSKYAAHNINDWHDVQHSPAYVNCACIAAATAVLGCRMVGLTPEHDELAAFEEAAEQAIIGLCGAKSSSSASAGAGAVKAPLHVWQQQLKENCGVQQESVKDRYRHQEQLCCSLCSGCVWAVACQQHKKVTAAQQQLLQLCGCSSRLLLWAAGLGAACDSPEFVRFAIGSCLSCYYKADPSDEYRPMPRQRWQHQQQVLALLPALILQWAVIERDRPQRLGQCLCDSVSISCGLLAAYQHYHQQHQGQLDCMLPAGAVQELLTLLVRLMCLCQKSMQKAHNGSSSSSSGGKHPDAPADVSSSNNQQQPFGVSAEAVSGTVPWSLKSWRLQLCAAAFIAELSLPYARHITPQRAGTRAPAAHVLSASAKALVAAGIDATVAATPAATSWQQRSQEVCALLEWLVRTHAAVWHDTEGYTVSRWLGCLAAPADRDGSRCGQEHAVGPLLLSAIAKGGLAEQRLFSLWTCVMKRSSCSWVTISAQEHADITKTAAATALALLHHHIHTAAQQQAVIDAADTAAGPPAAAASDRASSCNGSAGGASPGMAASSSSIDACQGASGVGGNSSRSSLVDSRVTTPATGSAAGSAPAAGSAAAGAVQVLSAGASAVRPWLCLLGRCCLQWVAVANRLSAGATGAETPAAAGTAAAADDSECSDSSSTCASDYEADMLLDDLQEFIGQLEEAWKQLSNSSLAGQLTAAGYVLQPIEELLQPTLQISLPPASQAIETDVEAGARGERAFGAVFRGLIETRDAGDCVEGSHSSTQGAERTDGSEAAGRASGGLQAAQAAEPPPAQLTQRLVAIAHALCTVPMPLACNNPSCVSLCGESELALVGGRSCVCAGCLTARYCSKACLAQHWKKHKLVCKSLAAAANAAAAAAAAASVPAGSAGPFGAE